MNHFMVRYRSLWLGIVIDILQNLINISFKFLPLYWSLVRQTHLNIKTLDGVLVLHQTVRFVDPALRR